MKKILPLVLVLAACSKEVSPSQSAANNAIDTITAIHQSLPEQCKTQANETLFNVAQREIQSVVEQCDIEKAEIERIVIKWRTFAVLLSLLILAYIIRKIIK